jgi:glycosyltransferase-like protein
VWTLGRGGDAGFYRPVDAAVRIVVVPFPDRAGEGVGERVVRSIALLSKAFDPGRYDVVHAQDCISANAVGRCVRTVHHIDQFTTPELAACHERAIRGPYAHVCVSTGVAAELARDWGVTATVIPNGVDAARFAAAAGPSAAAVAARERWRARFGRYVLTVGGIEPRKGSLDLLRAYGLLRRWVPDVCLVVAGGETLFDYRAYRVEWDALAQALRVKPAVLGAVPDDDLPALVAGASAFGFPSTKEGFGLAAMEALAAGVPVITRDLPVLREVFGDAARYATSPAGFADALAVVLADPDPARAAAGRALAARHTWDRCAAAHLAFYAALPAGRSPAAPGPLA